MKNMYIVLKIGKLKEKYIYVITVPFVKNDLHFLLNLFKDPSIQTIFVYLNGLISHTRKKSRKKSREPWRSSLSQCPYSFDATFIAIQVRENEQMRRGDKFRDEWAA